jgi:TonB family protein
MKTECPDYNGLAAGLSGLTPGDWRPEPEVTRAEREGGVKTVPPAGSWRYPVERKRRVVMLISLMASVALHGAFILGFDGRKAAKTTVATSDAVEVTFNAPPPEKEEDTPELADFADMAGESGETLAGVDVPALPDVISTVNLGDFVQPFDMASLLPRADVDGLKGMTTIPVGARRGGAGGTASGLAGGVFSLADLDRAPTPTFQPAPEVPGRLRNRAAGVLVTVEFIVTTKGTVVDAVVVKSDNTDFDDTALKTVKRWKFRPGYKRGKTVNTRMQQPIRFKVSGDE